VETLSRLPVDGVQQPSQGGLTITARLGEGDGMQVDDDLVRRPLPPSTLCRLSAPCRISANRRTWACSIWARAWVG